METINQQMNMSSMTTNINQVIQQGFHECKQVKFIESFPPLGTVISKTMEKDIVRANTKQSHPVESV